MKNWLKTKLGLLMPDKCIIWRDTLPSNKIYLTFDDGPCPIRTDSVLQALASRDIRATFFFLGRSMTEHEDLVKKTFSLGHTIGNHTFSHHSGSHLLFGSMFNEIRETASAIEAITGTKGIMIRPPYGKITLPLLLYAVQKKYSVIMWSFDSNDSFTSNDIDLLRRLDMVRGGDILLFHDDTDITVRNIDAILDGLKERGFEFGLVEEMLENHEMKPNRKNFF